MWGNAGSSEMVGKESQRVLEKREVLYPCSAKIPPRASALESSDLPSLSSVVAVVVFSNDLCGDEAVTATNSR